MINGNIFSHTLKHISMRNWYKLDLNFPLNSPSSHQLLGRIKCMLIVKQIMFYSRLYIDEDEITYKKWNEKNSGK